jgi:hypothetical protein
LTFEFNPHNDDFFRTSFSGCSSLMWVWIPCCVTIFGE